MAFAAQSILQRSPAHARQDTPVHLRLTMASKLTHLSLQQFRWVVAYNNQLCWTQVRRSARVAEPNAASIRWLLRAVDVQFAPASMASRL